MSCVLSRQRLMSWTLNFFLLPRGWDSCYLAVILRDLILLEGRCSDLVVFCSLQDKSETHLVLGLKNKQMRDRLSKLFFMINVLIRIFSYLFLSNSGRNNVGLYLQFAILLHGHGVVLGWLRSGTAVSLYFYRRSLIHHHQHHHLQSSLFWASL